ncbi:MAG: polysaccharide deacetylase family protein [Chloroflexota bacterium]
MNTSTNLNERLGYAPDTKLLIIHADDVGLSHAENQATFDAMATGMVSSASIMVPCPWFTDSAAYVRAHPALDIGVHITLTSEWKYYRWGSVASASDVPSLLDEQGYLHASSMDVATHADPREAEIEARAQIERALAFGIQPTHIDTHMGSICFTPDLFAVYLKLGREYNLPLLLIAPMIDNMGLRDMLQPSDIVLDKLFIPRDAGPIHRWEDHMRSVFAELAPGVSQMIVHLAYDNAEMRAIGVDHPDYGSAWRQWEFDMVTHPTFATLLTEYDIQLITWREVGKLLVSE